MTLITLTTFIKPPLAPNTLIHINDAYRLHHQDWQEGMEVVDNYAKSMIKIDTLLRAG